MATLLLVIRFCGSFCTIKLASSKILARHILVYVRGCFSVTNYFAFGGSLRKVSMPVLMSLKLLRSSKRAAGINGDGSSCRYFLVTVKKRKQI